MAHLTSIDFNHKIYLFYIVVMNNNSSNTYAVLMEKIMNKSLIRLFVGACIALAPVPAQRVKAQDTKAVPPVVGVFKASETGVLVNRTFGYGFSIPFPSMEACLSGANKIQETFSLDSGICLDPENADKSKVLKWNSFKSHFEFVPKS